MRTALLASLLLLLVATAARAEGEAQLTGFQPALGGGEGPAALAMYRLPEERFTIELGPEQRHRSYVRREVRYPSPVRDRWPVITGTYYTPIGLRETDQRPAAVIVHHLAGDFGAEAYMAQHLAQAGVPAVFIALPNYGPRREPGTKQGFLRQEDPVGGFAAFRQAALDVIRSADFLRAMPGVDPRQVGVVGVSLGAVVSALARGVDPRLGRTVLVIGGGDVMTLLRESREVQGVLEEGLRKAQVKLEDLPGLLAPVDPLTFAGRVRTEDVLMLNARRDEVIPEKCTLSLWEAMGRPRIEWMDCGHYGVVLHVLRVMNSALDHIRGEREPHGS